MAARLTLLAFCVLALLAPSASAKARPPLSVSLGEGRLGKFTWSASAQRGSGREGGAHGGQRPFVSVGVGHPTSPHFYVISEVGAGTGIPGHLTAKGRPTKVINGQFVDDKIALTAVAMVFAPAAVRIEIEGADGEIEKIHLHRLNAIQAHKARLERIRYTAFALRGDWCPKRIVSFNVKGAKLWEDDEAGCSGEQG